MSVIVCPVRFNCVLSRLVFFSVLIVFQQGFCTVSFLHRILLVLLEDEGVVDVVVGLHLAHIEDKPILLAVLVVVHLG